MCASAQVVESPRLFYLSNFISKAEAEHIKLTAEPRMTRSQVPLRNPTPNHGGYANEAINKYSYRWNKEAISNNNIIMHYYF